MTASVTDICELGRRAGDRVGRGSAAASTPEGSATAASPIRTGQVIEPGAPLDGHDPQPGEARIDSFVIR
ncbi:hypothetical protein ABZ413_07890 [Nocardia rhamnosiphila]|uniref:hypothetical protein n=1 Tax=Nocardia rhamnosiphila TaxID=426716 RepID=UPI0033FF98B4